jgi:TetR/AcrR family transcriptional regulator, mexJK operon transcriptional repressor
MINAAMASNVDQPLQADRRVAILDAATSVFVDRGFADTTMDDVAAAARASKQTLYRLFGDKVGLFEAVITSNIADATVPTDPHIDALRHTDDVERDLARFARQHLRDVLQPHLMRIRRLVIAEADRFPTLAQTWFERGPERAHDTFAALFSHLTDRGILRTDRPRSAAEHFNWLILSIPLHRSLYLPNAQPTESEIDEIADEAVRIFLAAYTPT